MKKEDPEKKIKIQELEIKKTDKAYPDCLKQINAAPKAIYVKGGLPDFSLPAVAIIGARECSAYGRKMAEWYGGILAENGVQIISGMAKGIDGIAQRAALHSGGRSFGVLGCGTGVCYPKENRDLYERLPLQGGLISEFSKDSPPIAAHFPRRNRIISAFSDIVLVVEAREKSGTLITVDFALEQGKEIFALPGRLNDGLSGGCNRLLFQGAGISLSPYDILEILEQSRMENRKGWRRTGENKKSGTEEMKNRGKEEAFGHNSPENGKAAADLQTVLEYMENRPVSAQEIFDRLTAQGCVKENGEAFAMQEIMRMLMELAMAGKVIQERGNLYVAR